MLVSQLSSKPFVDPGGGGDMPTPETTTTIGGGTRSTTTLSKPAGTVSGDKLYAGLVHYDSAETWTPPAGWTQVGQTQDADGWTYLTVFSKTAGASEPTSYGFVLSSSNYTSGNMIRVSGATEVPHVTNSGGAPGSDILLKGLTTTLANCLLLAFAASYSTAVGTTNEGSWTIESAGDGGYSNCYSNTNLATAGTEGDTDCGSNDFAWASYTIALAPA